MDYELLKVLNDGEAERVARLIVAGYTLDEALLAREDARLRDCRSIEQLFREGAL